MSTIRCAQCASHLVQITLNQGGSTVTMKSCSKCDLRSWHEDGQPMPLGRVLQVVGSR